MEYVLGFWKVLSHLDLYLVSWSHSMGGWLYGLLFAVIFCETGLVVTPFLPGDSLLFATGALCAMGGLNIALVLPLMLAAAVLGDAANYFGRFNRRSEGFYQPNLEAAQS